MRLVRFRHFSLMLCLEYTILSLMAEGSLSWQVAPDPAYFVSTFHLFMICMLTFSFG